MSIIWSHVVGGTGTRSLRYHSSWVLLVAGAAYNLPLYVAVASGLPIQNVLATMSVLEMRRLIRRLGGNRLMRNY